MNAELFYETHAEQAIPLYLLSQTQWQEALECFTSAERNSFAIREFSGKTGEYCLLYNADGMVGKAYIGTGQGNSELALAHAALQLPANCYMPQSELTQGALLQWSLAQYRFDAYKKNTLQPRRLVVAAEQLNDVLPLARAQFLIRDLVNKPTADMGPRELSQAVEQLAAEFGAVFTQWVGKELLEENFPAIHAVGRAAVAEPRLLSLEWGNTSHPRVTLVGKGVCFDTGGLDIKTASGMRIMKKDMGGAAHVIGLAQWIMARGLPIRLHVLIPAVENAIGPDAFRPGDVLTMRNGLTVEIDNTDAEGRLVLADALVKACEQPPELLIDFATLTGAARVSLGTDIAAFFTNNDACAQEILEASQQASDPVWRMPLFAAYEDFLRSSIADLANSSDHPYAGAIIAALFLQRFIPSSVNWMHFDVMAWNIGNKPGRPEGGEALGFRTVAAYLLRTYG